MAIEPPVSERGERPTRASAAAVGVHRQGDSVRADDDEARGESFVRLTLGRYEDRRARQDVRLGGSYKCDDGRAVRDRDLFLLAVIRNDHGAPVDVLD